MISEDNLTYAVVGGFTAVFLYRMKYAPGTFRGKLKSAGSNLSTKVKSMYKSNNNINKSEISNAVNDAFRTNVNYNYNTRDF